MKNCLIVIILLSGVTTFSQTRIVNVIPEQGIVLDSGWEFHAGDNSEWAKPGLDDSKWQPVTFSDYNSYIPQLKSTDIGWFRLNLLIDSSLLQSQLAFQISQLGASEIYLNGKLFQQFGVIQTPLKYNSLNPGNKPILLPANLGSKITIAVRFASHIPSRTWLFTRASFKRSPLVLTINTWDNALSTYKASLKGAGMPPASYMLLVLAVLFLLLFAFFPKEKINLLFGLLCFFLAINAILGVQFTHGSVDISKFGLLSFILDLIGVTVGTLALLITSLIVLQRITIYVLIVICSMGLNMLIFFFFGPVYPGLVLDFVSRIAVMTAFFYLSLHAFRQRNYVIGIVALNSVIINVIGILIIYAGLNLNSFILFLGSTISFILITFYVSKNFGRKSRNLEVQLVEIGKLSEDNLKKEREKQQLLASQNETLEKQVAERTSALQKSLEDLKSTQSQLIQSEKMASLGQLTAGVAHEIQNPLNFVNNFSDINKELIEEVKSQKSKLRSEELDELLDNIASNEEKINHHGKRAESIVKGMLQHSRSSSGVKEPTDINALANEWLRLSFNGFRAKDKLFTATMKTDYDETIKNILVIPEDIGRILLNLYNNAFYAVTEKKRLKGGDYEPTVSVSTKIVGDRLLISVKDNGNGIPQKALDKIFQPFFTTKPTGQGTGLGLSLAYDIVKAHGGELKVKTKEGEESEFIIQIPT